MTNWTLLTVNDSETVLTANTMREALAEALSIGAAQDDSLCIGESGIWEIQEIEAMSTDPEWDWLLDMSAEGHLQRQQEAHAELVAQYWAGWCD